MCTRYKARKHKVQQEYSNTENVQQNIQILQMCSRIWKWSKYSKRKSTFEMIEVQNIVL